MLNQRLIINMCNILRVEKGMNPSGIKPTREKNIEIENDIQITLDPNRRIEPIQQLEKTGQEAYLWQVRDGDGEIDVVAADFAIGAVRRATKEERLINKCNICLWNGGQICPLTDLPLKYSVWEFNYYHGTNIIYYTYFVLKVFI